MTMSALRALGHTQSVGVVGSVTSPGTPQSSLQVPRKICKVSLVREGETVEVFGVRWR